MKALDWHKVLHRQRTDHGKTVFTVSELANIAQASPQVLNVQLGRMVKRGVMARYAHGRYGLADHVSPEQLIHDLDAGAYLTGFYALFRHHLVTQVPVEVTCFTNRRHNRSRLRETAAGRFVFVCVSPKIYAPPLEGKIAPPEQALCDYIYLAKAIDVRSLVTFRKLDTLDRERLVQLAERYPARVAATVAELIGEQSGTVRTNSRFCPSKKAV